MIRLSHDEERQAQHIACGHLVRGCEGAAAELLATSGEREEQSPTKKRSGEILDQVLASWRGALKGLTTTEEPGALNTPASSLDGWTGDELFAEAVTRSAEDPAALRLMQGVLLRARLTAHDRGVAADRLVS